MTHLAGTSWNFVAESVLEYTERSDLIIAFSANFPVFSVSPAAFQLLTKMSKTLRERSPTSTPQSAPSLHGLVSGGARHVGTDRGGSFAPCCPAVISVCSGVSEMSSKPIDEPDRSSSCSPSFSPVLQLQPPDQAVLALEYQAGLCAFTG